MTAEQRADLLAAEIRAKREERLKAEAEADPLPEPVYPHLEYFFLRDLIVVEKCPVCGALVEHDFGRIDGEQYPIPDFFDGSCEECVGACSKECAAEGSCEHCAGCCDDVCCRGEDRAVEWRTRFDLAALFAGQKLLQWVRRRGQEDFCWTCDIPDGPSLELTDCGGERPWTVKDLNAEKFIAHGYTWSEAARSAEEYVRQHDAVGSLFWLAR